MKNFDEIIEISDNTLSNIAQFLTGLNYKIKLNDEDLIVTFDSNLKVIISLYKNQEQGRISFFSLSHIKKENIDNEFYHFLNKLNAKFDCKIYLHEEDTFVISNTCQLNGISYSVINDSILFLMNSVRVIGKEERKKLNNYLA